MTGRAGRLVLVCGLPGAGKTTVAERLARQLPAVRMCPDEWMVQLGIDLWDQPARARIEQLQWRITQDLLPLGTAVVIEWGFWTRAERDTLRLRARELGAPVELHFLDALVDVLWQRIAQRDAERRFGSDRAIQRHELEEWARLFEAPAADELALYDDPAD